MTTISPKYSAIEAFYNARQALSTQHVTHELAVRPAFQNLLDGTRPRDWTLVMEQKVEGLKKVVRPGAPRGNRIRLNRSDGPQYAQVADELEQMLME